MLQALEYKDRNFLELLSDEGLFIAPTYTKEGT